jgi:cholesterol oxidase
VAAVGGGSISYHGMTLQPMAEAFAHVISSSIDYEELDRDQYRRVARDLKVSPIPDDVLADPRYAAPRILQKRGREAGYDTFRIDSPTGWDIVRRELRGELPPSYITGDMTFGCNNGGRHSVDVDRIDTGGNVLEKLRITTGALFLGGGSPGTTRLMMRARSKGTVPDLPEGRLGHQRRAGVRRRHDPGQPGRLPGGAGRDGGPGLVGPEARADDEDRSASPPG